MAAREEAFAHHMQDLERQRNADLKQKESELESRYQAEIDEWVSRVAELVS